MKFLIIFSAVLMTPSSFAQIPLKDAVGKKITVLKDIIIPAHEMGHHFQDGKQLSQTYYVPNSGPDCIFITGGPDWRTNEVPAVVKAGTTFTLTLARPEITGFEDFSGKWSVLMGYDFDTDSSIVKGLRAYPNDYKGLIENPALLDAKIIKQCFGDFLDIQ